MAKKISIKKELGKKTIKQRNLGKSTKIDVTEEGLKGRAKVRERLPSVTYVNTYPTKDRGKVSTYTVDLTQFVEKYPQNKELIEQFIVGFNEIIEPGRSPNNITTVIKGIETFIEFLNSEKNLSNNNVTVISNINVIVAQSFCNYLLSIYPKDTRKRRWFSTIRRIVERLQELYPKEPSVGKGFVWPTSPKVVNNTIIGYFPREMKQLWEACISDIKDIKSFNRTYVNFEEVDLIEKWNLENLMYYIDERWESVKISHAKPSKIRIEYIIRKSPKAQKTLLELGYNWEQIHDIYILRGSELASRGHSLYATKIDYKPDKQGAITQFNLALSTLKNCYPLFPYYYPLEEAKDLLNTKSKNLNKEPLCILINKVVNLSAGKIEFMNGNLGKMAVYAAMHFVTDTIYPFLLLCIINTGWNLETILSISDNVDTHTTADLLDPENYILIHGKKIRGSRYGEPKNIVHRSSTKNSLSTYKLLKYVESIVTQYKDSPHYKKGYLWQYTVPECIKHDLISTINDHPLLNGVSSRFIKRHRFEHFSDAAISHPKVRSGYTALRQLLGASERDISEDLGHKDEETIIHYISDQSSAMVQDLAIKHIQDQFIKDLTNFKVRIIESQSLQNLRKAINDAQTEYKKMKQIKKEAIKLGLGEKTIIHLLDAGSEKYILSCENCKRPSWPGFNKFVKEGQNCRYFNMCCLCTQAIVFPEALPYIARRIIDLEKLKSLLASAEWIIKYNDEFDAWNQILDNWNNREQVEKAWELARTGFVVLPQIMRGV